MLDIKMTLITSNRYFQKLDSKVFPQNEDRSSIFFQLIDEDIVKLKYNEQNVIQIISQENNIDIFKL